MKKLALVLGILALIGMVMPAFCAETTTTKGPSVTKGTVTKVDKANKKVSVKPTTGTEETFAIIEETAVLKDGEEIVIDDILVDDKVTVMKNGDVVETIIVEVIPE